MHQRAHPSKTNSMSQNCALCFQHCLSLMQCLPTAWVQNSLILPETNIFSIGLIFCDSIQVVAGTPRVMTLNSYATEK